MAGRISDEAEAKMGIQKWVSFVSRPYPLGSWEGNNLHLNEIDGFKEVERRNWVSASLSILNMFKEISFPSDLFSLFLHFDLKSKKEKDSVNMLALDWLTKNMGKYTPPSFHLCSVEYYQEFYMKELITCVPEEKILKRIDSSSDWKFYYRTYFDKSEQKYSREIYIFLSSE